MSPRRTHLQVGTDPVLGPRALCGWWGGKAARYTTDEDAVTCARCIARIADPPAPTYAEVLVASVGRIETGTGTRRAMVLPERRGDDERVKPWPSWRFALRSYIAALDDGVPMKSTSAPSRFGQRLDGGPSGPPQGDAGQRQAERYYAVARALSSTYPAGFVAMTTPRRVVAPTLCRGILVLMVAGRAVDRELDFKAAASPGERKRRGSIVTRIPIERRPVGLAAVESEARGSDIDTHICEPLSARCDFPVTPGHVAEIVRIGGLTIEALLERGGWVSQRDESLHRAGRGAEGEDMGTRVRGWPAIAAHLEVAIDTAKSMQEWDPPLPVTAFGVSVEADADELDAWRKSGPRRVRKAGAA